MLNQEKIPKPQNDTRVNNRVSLSKRVLSERFKRLWDYFDEQKFNSLSDQAIEGAAANPCGPLPLYAIKQANNHLTKNPSLLSTYSSTRGLIFIRRELANVCHSIGYKTYNGFELDEENVTLSPGINSALNLIIKYLRDQSKKQFPNKIPCVITSQYFYSIPDISGIEYISAQSDLFANDGTDPIGILNALERARKLNMNPIVFYNITPDNPTGKITSKKRAIAQAEVFRLPENKSVFVINDLSFHSTYLNNTDKTYPISCPGIRSAVIFGISKLAGPGSRIAAILSDGDFLKSLEMSSFSEYMFPAIHSQLMIYYFFKKSNRILLHSYLSKKNKQLDFNSKLMRVLICGISNTLEISDGELKKIYSIINSSGNDDLSKLLKSGINNISIINNPKAGFFHIVDFSSFKGKRYLNKEIHIGIDLVEVFLSISKTLIFPLDLLSLGNSNSKLNQSTLLMRVSYSMTYKEILGLVLSIKKVRDAIHA